MNFFFFLYLNSLKQESLQKEIAKQGSTCLTPLVQEK